MLTEESAKQLFINNLTQFYEQLSRGWDVSPGDRLRFEGKVELLLDASLLEWDWLKQTTSSLHSRILGVDVDDAYWSWIDDEGIFYIPFKMQDAPVYKG